MTTGTDTHDTPTEHLPGTISCRVAYKERTITSPVPYRYDLMGYLSSARSVRLLMNEGPLSIGDTEYEHD